MNRCMNCSCPLATGFKFCSSTCKTEYEETQPDDAPCNAPDADRPWLAN